MNPSSTLTSLIAVWGVASGTPREAIPFNEVKPAGELRTRIAKNFERLHADRYQRDKLFTTSHDPKWPGEMEGRAALGLVLDAQALGLDEPGMDALLAEFPKHYNKDGYIGSIHFPDHIDEPQLSSLCYRARPDPIFMPDGPGIKAKLDEIFGPQINVYFEVTVLPQEDIAFDVADANTYPGFTFNAGTPTPIPGNRSVDFKSWGSPEESLITTNRSGNYNIHVFIFGGGSPIINYQRSQNNPMELVAGDSATGQANVGIDANYCTIDGDRDYIGINLQSKTIPAVIDTIAHEIGHIMTGGGHPDEGGGDAPLKGTDRTKRLMCSGPNRPLNSKLLVKTEWDKAEAWLKSEETRLGRSL